MTGNIIDWAHIADVGLPVCYNNGDIHTLYLCALNDSYIYIYGFSIAYLTLFLILLHFQLCAQISGSSHVHV